MQTRTLRIRVQLVDQLHVPLQVDGQKLEAVQDVLEERAVGGDHDRRRTRAQRAQSEQGMSFRRPPTVASSDSDVGRRLTLLAAGRPHLHMAICFTHRCVQPNLG